MRFFGVRSRVVLYAMGGVTIPTRNMAERWQRVTVSLAGPLTGLILLGLPAVYFDRHLVAPQPPWDSVIVYLVWVNVAWSVVNLLPILPLDGGNVTKELLDAGTNG